MRRTATTAISAGASNAIAFRSATAPLREAIHDLLFAAAGAIADGHLGKLKGADMTARLYRLHHDLTDAYVIYCGRGPAHRARAHAKIELVVAALLSEAAALTTPPGQLGTLPSMDARTVTATLLQFPRRPLPPTRISRRPRKEAAAR